MEKKGLVDGIGVKAWISTLWIVVMINMIYADILSFMLPGVLKKIMGGYADGLAITPGILLVFAGLIEIPIAMIFLSRALGRRANRLANIIACVVTAAFVIGGGSLHPHYVFFAGMEIACMAAIVWLTLKWPELADASAAKEERR